ncbi:hypothetical protein BDV25DRAFT_140413 [Aspergillus avenaceus]|uniref:Uncharacterized protein n=1 Tax=Aspergillus avenaceus TaxID=36643 RepID=A0A5N6TTZ1_ASPAV|nr:hypothetical protein BDV25DRAFT_140413 [Aspergillus avenaceus]
MKPHNALLVLGLCAAVLAVPRAFQKDKRSLKTWPDIGSSSQTMTSTRTYTRIPTSTRSTSITPTPTRQPDDDDGFPWPWPWPTDLPPPFDDWFDNGDYPVDDVPDSPDVDNSAKRLPEMPDFMDGDFPWDNLEDAKMKAKPSSA